MILPSEASDRRVRPFGCALTRAGRLALGLGREMGRRRGTKGDVHGGSSALQKWPARGPVDCGNLRPEASLGRVTLVLV
jgi:hypothetical protein